MIKAPRHGTHDLSHSATVSVHMEMLKLGAESLPRTEQSVIQRMLAVLPPPMKSHIEL